MTVSRVHSRESQEGLLLGPESSQRQGGASHGGKISTGPNEELVTTWDGGWGLVSRVEMLC